MPTEKSEMYITEIKTSKGNIVRIRDPLKRGTPEWDARQEKWEKATADFVRAVERRHPGYWKRFTTKQGEGEENG